MRYELSSLLVRHAKSHVFIFKEINMELYVLYCAILKVSREGKRDHKCMCYIGCHHSWKSTCLYQCSFHGNEMTSILTFGRAIIWMNFLGIRYSHLYGTQLALLVGCVHET